MIKAAVWKGTKKRQKDSNSPLPPPPWLINGWEKLQGELIRGGERGSGQLLPNLHFWTVSRLLLLSPPARLPLSLPEYSSLAFLFMPNYPQTLPVDRFPASFAFAFALPSARVGWRPWLICQAPLYTFAQSQIIFQWMDNKYWMEIRACNCSLNSPRLIKKEPAKTLLKTFSLPTLITKAFWHFCSLWQLSIWPLSTKLVIWGPSWLIMKN